MSSSRYFLFNDMLEDTDLGFRQSQIWKLPRQRISWISGAPHRKPVSEPIEVELNPEFGTELLDSYHESIPVWSDRLVSLLRDAGVESFHTYAAVIRDPRTGLTATYYKAVNVLGLVDCVDMARSEFDPRSERGAREFTKLVIDPAKAADLPMFRLSERPTLLIVESRVKTAIESASLRGIRLDPLAHSSD